MMELMEVMKGDWWEKRGKVRWEESERVASGSEMGMGSPSGGAESPPGGCGSGGLGGIGGAAWHGKWQQEDG